MEVNIPAVVQDGDDDDVTQNLIKAPPTGNLQRQSDDTKNGRRKRRRGKSKRKMIKPYIKKPWQDRRRNEKTKRDNRYRSLGLAKTHAPFNNNQFLMEIHKPEPENNFQILQTPSGRTRDSSFSVDSEDNYFYSLPEDEEDFLTKEFSSVYEDAQSERLSNMSKMELIQEYLLLEAKYDNVIKRSDRSKGKSQNMEEGGTSSGSEQDISPSDKDTTGTSVELSTIDDSIQEYLSRLKEQEDQIRDLKLANEKLRLENELLRQKSHCSSSEDSESDSSSTSMSSSSSSSRAPSPVHITNGQTNGEVNGHSEENASDDPPLVNGYGNHEDHD